MRNLRELRHKRGLTLAQVAKRVGVSLDYISKIEKGQRTPSVKTLEKLAVALGVSVSFLLDERRRRQKVTKEIVEFKRIEAEATLALSAFALSPEEHKDTLAELGDMKGMTLNFVDADSIRSEVRGEYEDVLELMDKLKDNGWRWNG